MTDAYLEHRLSISLGLMDAAADSTARLAHRGLARAYAARLAARRIVQALPPLSGPDNG